MLLKGRKRPTVLFFSFLIQRNLFTECLFCDFSDRRIEKIEKLCCCVIEEFEALTDLIDEMHINVNILYEESFGNHTGCIQMLLMLLKNISILSKTSFQMLPQMTIIKDKRGIHHLLDIRQPLIPSNSLDSPTRLLKNGYPIQASGRSTPDIIKSFRSKISHWEKYKKERDLTKFIKSSKTTKYRPGSLLSRYLMGSMNRFKSKLNMDKLGTPTTVIVNQTAFKMNEKRFGDTPGTSFKSDEKESSHHFRWGSKADNAINRNSKTRGNASPKLSTTSIAASTKDEVVSSSESDGKYERKTSKRHIHNIEASAKSSLEYPCSKKGVLRYLDHSTSPSTQAGEEVTSQIFLGTKNSIVHVNSWSSQSLNQPAEENAEEMKHVQSGSSGELHPAASITDEHAVAGRENKSSTQTNETDVMDVELEHVKLTSDSDLDSKSGITGQRNSNPSIHGTFSVQQPKNMRRVFSHPYRQPPGRKNVHQASRILSEARTEIDPERNSINGRSLKNVVSSKNSSPSIFSSEKKTTQQSTTTSSDFGSGRFISQENKVMRVGTSKTSSIDRRPGQSKTTISTDSSPSILSSEKKTTQKSTTTSSEMVRGRFISQEDKLMRVGTSKTSSIDRRLGQIKTTTSIDPSPSISSSGKKTVREPAKTGSEKKSRRFKPQEDGYLRVGPSKTTSSDMSSLRFLSQENRDQQTGHSRSISSDRKYDYSMSQENRVYVTEGVIQQPILSHTSSSDMTGGLFKAWKDKISQPVRSGTTSSERRIDHSMSQGKKVNIAKGASVPVLKKVACKQSQSMKQKGKRTYLYPREKIDKLPDIEESDDDDMDDYLSCVSSSSSPVFFFDAPAWEGDDTNNAGNVSTEQWLVNQAFLSQGVSAF